MRGSDAEFTERSLGGSQRSAAVCCRQAGWVRELRGSDRSLRSACGAAEAQRRISLGLSRKASTNALVTYTLAGFERCKDDSALKFGQFREPALRPGV